MARTAWRGSDLRGEQKTGRVETFGGCDSEREMPSDLERRVLASGMETKRAPVACGAGAGAARGPIASFALGLETGRPAAII